MWGETNFITSHFYREMVRHNASIKFPQFTIISVWFNLDIFSWVIRCVFPFSLLFIRLNICKMRLYWIHLRLKNILKTSLVCFSSFHFIWLQLINSLLLFSHNSEPINFFLSSFELKLLSRFIVLYVQCGQSAWWHSIFICIWWFKLVRLSLCLYVIMVELIFLF